MTIFSHILCSKGNSSSPSRQLSDQPGNFSSAGSISRKELGLFLSTIWQFFYICFSFILELLPWFRLKTVFPSILSTYWVMDKYADDADKRTVSPYRFPLLRTGSISSRPTTPNTSRTITPKKSRKTTPNPSRPTTPNPSRPTTPNPSIGRQVRVWILAFGLLDKRKRTFYLYFRYVGIINHTKTFDTRLHSFTSIFWSIGNQYPCGFLLKETSPKKSKLKARANAFWRHCWAERNRRKMTRYTHTWMNTNECYTLWGERITKELCSWWHKNGHPGKLRYSDRFSLIYPPILQ